MKAPPYKAASRNKPDDTWRVIWKCEEPEIQLETGNPLKNFTSSGIIYTKKHAVITIASESGTELKKKAKINERGAIVILEDGVSSGWNMEASADLTFFPENFESPSEIK